MKRRKNPSRGNQDIHASRELYLFIANDRDLYRQQTVPIINNLRRKVKKGIYKPELAVKLWRYLADNGAKKYTFEHDTYSSTGTYAHHAATWRQIKGYGIFNVSTREGAARMLRDHYLSETIRPGTKTVENPFPGIRIVHNKLLGGWYVVRGPHQTPLNGRFSSKAEAEAWLNQRRTRSNPIKGPGKFEGELYITRYAHENPDEEIGDVQELNWFGRFSGKVKGRGPFHIITEENSQGFVWGKLYDSEKEMMKAWHEVEREYDQFYEQQGND
jgi:hypothetical protein